MKLILLWLAPLLLAASCKKEMDELSKLPPATQTGANTFGCLVNGKAWLPDNSCTLLCPLSLKFYYYNDNGGELSISAYNKINTNKFIGIGIDSLRYHSNYSSNRNKNIFGLNYSNRNINGSCGRFLPNDSTVLSVGTITISSSALWKELSPAHLNLH